MSFNRDTGEILDADVELNSAEKRGRCGVTRNASDHGLLIVTASRFKEADRLELAVHSEGGARRMAARIVRIDENPPRSPELWRYRLAVELEEPLPATMLEGHTPVEVPER